MKNLKFLMIGIAVIMFACSSSNDDEEMGGITDTTENNLLRVMSFNIRYAAATDTGDNAWDVRKTAVVKMINTEQPDVVGLQEPRTEQREYLKNNLRTYGFLEVPGTGTGTGGNTCLIYRRDRFTLVEDGYFYLSYTPDTASRCFDVQDTQWRTSVWVHLKETSTGKEFYFLSTHLPVRTNSSYDNNPYIEARKLSAQLDIDRMKSIAGENAMCFIVGDMNCSDKTATGDTSADGAAVLQIFKSWMSAARDLDMLKNVYSFNDFGSGTQSPARNLDHIYYRNATGIQFQTLTANYGVQYVSDHYPIMLTALF